MTVLPTSVLTNYARPDVPAQFYYIFRGRYDLNAYQMVEPSAGDGAFFRLLPASGLGYDLEPKRPGIKLMGTGARMAARDMIARGERKRGNPT